MLSPFALLAIAEEIASRIPLDDGYAHERNDSWLAIGKAYLTINDFPSTCRALNHLDDSYQQAQLRLAAGLWSGDHPDSISASDLLRDTVEQIAIWEDAFSGRDLTDLVNPAFKILGPDHIYAMAAKLKDPFIASHVLVTLAGCLEDSDNRRATLGMAEGLAVSVPPGNRDYALRWVVSGYRHAGFEEDEKRARALMSQDLDFMNASEASMFADVEVLLRPIEPPAPDTPLLKLLRFMDYGCNDLRVLFLTELCGVGGLDDPEAEQLVLSPTFRQITPAHPPSIYLDPSLTNVEELAWFLFGRPRCQHDSDRRYIDGTGFLTIADVQRFIHTVRKLFQNFGEIGRRFSPEQVDTGLWYLFGEPYWLGTLVTSEDVPAPLIETL